MVTLLLYYVVLIYTMVALLWFLLDPTTFHSLGWLLEPILCLALFSILLYGLYKGFRK